MFRKALCVMRYFGAMRIGTGYSQTELKTCCLGRKHKSSVLFGKYSNPISMFQ